MKLPSNDTILGHIVAIGLWAVSAAAAEPSPAKGICVYREREWYKDDRLCQVEECTEIFATKDGIRIVANNVPHTVLRTLYVDYVPYPNLASFQNLETPESIESLKREVGRITEKLHRFPQAGKFLSPYLGKLQAQLAEFNSGKVKRAGKWIARSEIQASLELEKRRVEEERKLEKQRQAIEKKNAEVERTEKERQIAKSKMDEERLAADHEKKMREEQELETAAANEARAGLALKEAAARPQQPQQTPQRGREETAHSPGFFTQTFLVGTIAFLFVVLLLAVLLRKHPVVAEFLAKTADRWPVGSMFVLLFTGVGVFFFGPSFAISATILCVAALFLFVLVARKSVLLAFALPSGLLYFGMSYVYKRFPGHEIPLRAQVIHAIQMEQFEKEREAEKSKNGVLTK